MPGTTPITGSRRVGSFWTEWPILKSEWASCADYPNVIRRHTNSGRMTPLELAVLDAWRDGRAARCGHCGQLHQPGEVACADGVWALPSLASGEPGGFARVQVSTFQARYQAVRGPAIGVAHSVIVVRDPPGSSPVVWRFDGAREEWARTGETWARFEPIGSADLFVLALPPAGRGPA